MTLQQMANQGKESAAATKEAVVPPPPPGTAPSASRPQLGTACEHGMCALVLLCPLAIVELLYLQETF